MYKRLAGMLFICVLLLPFSVSAKGSDLYPLLAADTEENPSGEEDAANQTDASDILIVYPKDLSKTQRDSLCYLVECFTFLGYSSCLLAAK
jgi:hypothetical protein